MEIENYSDPLDTDLLNSGLLDNETESYLKYAIDLTADLPNPYYLFSIFDVPTIPAGELVGITGKAKQGKSMLVYLLTSVLLSRRVGVIEYLQDDFKAFLFDTEQSKCEIRNGLIRAYKRAGLHAYNYDSRLTAFYLRPLTVETRREVIGEAIIKEKPDIVFIDGVRDLLYDINNVGETAKLVNWLLRLISECGCTIIYVLHQNKSDTNLRGHLGTELLNKAADCFSVVKGDGIFSVTSVASRNAQPEPIYFGLDNDLGFIMSSNGKSIDTKTQDFFTKLFKVQEKMQYSQLVKIISDKSNLSEWQAKYLIKKALNMGVVERTEVGRESYYSIAP